MIGTAPAPLIEVARLLGAGHPFRRGLGFGVPGGEWVIEPSFTGFSDPPPPREYCLGKVLSCLRDSDARMSCAEVEIAKRITVNGWTGGWINTYGGDPPLRWLEWAKTPGELAALLPADRKRFGDSLAEAAAARRGGIPDLVLVRENTVLALECKRRSGDSPKLTQQLWLSSAIGEQGLLSPDEFAVVLWIRAPAPATWPTVLPEHEPTRKYPAGRPLVAPPIIAACSSHTEARRERPKRPQQGLRPSSGATQEVGRTMAADRSDAPQPSEHQWREARDGVTSRGWEPSGAKAHNYRPRGIRDGDVFRPCEHCEAKTNPARWPLFFRAGEHAGRLLWTCSTCKRTQADRHDLAEVLVSAPLNPDVSRG